ncbi:MAG: tyrosine recombinase XerC [Oscillospiraceae bacterium]|nr:tyrosine recombinase XerC [Oscillospiraceae bacterium]
MDYRNGASPLLLDFLSYHETIRGHSPKTVDEYFLDLRGFFRFLKLHRGLVPPDSSPEDIDISDVDLDFLRTVTRSEIYAYLSYLSRDKLRNARSRSPSYGLSPASRARKIAAIRSLYKYLTVKTRQLAEDPVRDLDAPKLPRTLPRYLSLEESRRLLRAVEGRQRTRDYCILCIFLNCGLRISEIVGLNLGDLRADHLRVAGKGGKERVVFLNDAVAEALNDYLALRTNLKATEPGALFLTASGSRVSRAAVHAMVKKTLLRAGLDAEHYSAHKLRHTAATLMLQNGVDVRTLQELLGHEHLNTTQIYTHVDSGELRTAARANPLARFSPNSDDTEEP